MSAPGAAESGAQELERPRVLLVGLDGADWSRARELVAAGRLPHWEELIERGVAGPLQSQIPTWSPILWTTVLTGVRGEQHGILDFTEISLPGQEQGVQRLRVVERLALQPGGGSAPVAAHTGLEPLVYGAVRRGWLHEEPIHGYHRRVPALQNVLSAAGKRVAVVRWWATWPAEQVNGFVVSDDQVRWQARAQHENGRSGALATYPPAYIERLAELEDPTFGRFTDEAHWWRTEDRAASVERALALPLFADLDAERRAALAGDPGLLELAWNTWEDDRFGVAAAADLLAAEDLDFAAVYTSLIDVLGHRLERFARGDSAYLAIIDRAYEESDRLLGRLLEERGPETTVIVVSDHGWSYANDRYGHYDGPAGLFLISGAGIVPGARLVETPTILDVAPTVLSLFRLPASAEWPGNVLSEVLAAEYPAERVPSFGAYRPRWPELPRSATDGGSDRTAEIARLRALGYVQ